MTTLFILAIFVLLFVIIFQWLIIRSMVRSERSAYLLLCQWTETSFDRGDIRTHAEDLAILRARTRNHISKISTLKRYQHEAS